MTFDLAEIARILGTSAPLSGPVTGYSIDSRTVAPADLFFAIRGENFDGNSFVGDVLAKGATAAVVEHELPFDRVLRVPDTLAALQDLARSALTRWGGKVVGVTGSAGKTTTKDIIASLLGRRVRTGKTVGNFNNHIGLPLSILRLPDDAEAAVLEYGMNHAGEIRALSSIGKPDIAVVTNVGYAHIESFESIDDIAAAKRELVEALSSDGVAVLNADDERVRTFAQSHPGKSILYGLSEHAQLRATDVDVQRDGVAFRIGTISFQSPIAGRHSIRNILAGIAVASLFEIELEDLPAAVSSLTPAKMRGERVERDGVVVINDCYNSNPDAVQAMLELLREIPAERHIAVLGEMLELGHWAEPLHRDVGRYAVRCGITVLVGIRGGARSMVEAATEAGLAKNAAFFFEDPVEAGAHLRELAQPGDAILFKGSRATRVEKALEKFLE